MSGAIAQHFELADCGLWVAGYTLHQGVKLVCQAPDTVVCKEDRIVVKLSGKRVILAVAREFNFEAIAARILLVNRKTYATSRMLFDLFLKLETKWKAGRVA